MSTPDPLEHIPPRVRDLLDSSGVEWDAVRLRSRIAIRVRGRVCQSFPLSSGRVTAGRYEKNALATVKRALRQT